MTSEILEGAPAASIDDFACARGADLVVLGTHARSGLALGVLGSVTAEVVRSSRLPVVTVRAETVLSETGPIVVAVDDSEASAAAARVALTIAAELGAPIQLIFVDAHGDPPPAALGDLAREAAAAGVVCSTQIRHGAERRKHVGSRHTRPRRARTALARQRCRRFDPPLAHSGARRSMRARCGSESKASILTTILTETLAIACEMSLSVSWGAAAQTCSWNAQVRPLCALRDHLSLLLGQRCIYV